MDDAVRELVALGKEHFQRGDWSLAAGHLEQVIARGVAFADVHHMLGVCYHQMGEFDPAQRAFERALEINPGYVEASLNLAILCNDLGQYEKAQKVYSNALERSRDGAQATSGDEPVDAFTCGKLADAIEQWEEVLRMDPRHRTAQLYLKLARAQAPAAAGRAR